ncbi:cytosine/adenosine deaminase-related metal-dependent hydrolase [Kribbella aluminosa]|uniref:Cytosine/adenosine deaminase-related metal-dependent hydrolase n=1 Tax=Kribbella aluminosa TaxID=416017 RepID=A0ABS4UJN5_9ACTN|nr:chlorohydrolase family protein [Kribbella aluminosa]MBP2351835.1 cytosine/adenosine deaminase-related metal-dependent hydrolase [Kribbella aluminosa]
MGTAVHARFVLGFDRGEHVLLEDATVIYDGSVVVYVGPRRDTTADRVVELGQALVIPGLIDLDAVADIDHALLDSWAPAHTASGLQWSEDYFTSRRTDVFDPEERTFIRRYALAQLLLYGVTTCMPIASEVHSSWAETYDDAIGIAEAARDLGIRAYVGPSYRSGVNVLRADGTRDVLWDHDLGRAGLDDAARFLSSADNTPDSLVRGALLPCRIETMSFELLESTAKLAREYDVPVRLHCMQSELELELLQRRHGAGPLELMERSGLLGCRLLVPHAVHGSSDRDRRSPSDGELAALAGAGASVVHCPSTSLRYGMVLDTFDRFTEAGVNVTLGSDSFPPDLLRAMDEGSCLAKVLERRLDAGDLATYFRAATLHAAHALGREDLGRLAPGAQADFVALRLDDFRLGVVDDPLRTVVMAGSPRDVALSVVAGRTVVEDGQLPGVDLAAMKARAQSLFARMRAAYSTRDALGRDQAALFPPVFRRVDRALGSCVSTSS